MDNKQCTQCHEIKLLDQFSPGQSRCKICRSNNQKEYRDAKREETKNILIKKKNYDDFSFLSVNNNSLDQDPDSLSKEDIIILKKIISNFKESPKFSYKDFIQLNKSNRQPKSINFDIEVMSKLTKLSDKEHISISDLVNAIISKYFSES